MGFVNDMTGEIAKGMAMRVNQKVQVCIKPKPRLLTQKMWLKIASKFIYIEMTEPSFTVVDKSVTL